MKPAIFHFISQFLTKNVLFEQPQLQLADGENHLCDLLDWHKRRNESLRKILGGAVGAPFSPFMKILNNLLNPIKNYRAFTFTDSVVIERVEYTFNEKNLFQESVEFIIVFMSELANHASVLTIYIFSGLWFFLSSKHVPIQISV